MACQPATDDGASQESPERHDGGGQKATIVKRSETGESTAMCNGFAEGTAPGRYSRGVRSSDVMVFILVTNHRARSRFKNSR